MTMKRRDSAAGTESRLKSFGMKWAKNPPDIRGLENHKMRAPRLYNLKRSGSPEDVGD